MRRERLKTVFQALQEQMEAKLKEIRLSFDHSGDKGEHVEHGFRTFLRQYLPRTLSVGHGEIFDSSGRRSKQTDIVIATQDHPFTFPEDLPGLFFIEGVCGAGEAKTTISSTELADTITKSRRFKRLRADLGRKTLDDANESDKRRFYVSPPWFLIAFETRMTLNGIVSRIKSASRQDESDVNYVLDAVFVLHGKNKGWAINLGDGKGRFCYRHENGERGCGWIWRSSPSPLLKFLGWLSLAMPRYVRFDPVLLKYLLRQYKFD